MVTEATLYMYQKHWIDFFHIELQLNYNWINPLQGKDFKQHCLQLEKMV
jgi:hypothetical protein